MNDGPVVSDWLANVSRETLEKLKTYHSVLSKWNSAINLVSPGTLDDAWSRHFLDSAQLLRLAPRSSTSWCDLGSGGGFPGAVVAVLAQDMQPDLRVTLIESDHRKAEFLRTVGRECDVDLNVVVERAETATPAACEVLSARALAPLPDLLGYAIRHLAPGGLCLFPKGRNHHAELRQALESWSFRCETTPSQTDAESVILKIEGIERGHAS